MNELSLRQSVPETLRGIHVVDADTHISEWDDLWLSRAPGTYKDRVPQRKMKDGRRIWMIDGDKTLGMLSSAVSAVRPDGSKSNGCEFMSWELEDVHPSSYQVKARLKYMDDAGIHAQIGYPNLLGFSGQKSALVDPALRLVTTQIYNDAMADMQVESGNRIFPMALLPWWDVKESVAEAKRCAKRGLRGVNINPDPQLHGLPNLADRHWYPLWEACVADDLPVNFHVGGGDIAQSFCSTGQWSEALSNAHMAFGSAMAFFTNARILANIILAQFLHDFPTLKIVSVESGIGWIPFLLEALQYQISEMDMKYPASPTEIFRRQIYGCSWFERDNFVADAHRLGVDNIMFETDYPHPVCLYPNALDYVAETAGKFTAETRAKIFSTNAARVYRIPLPG